ncbi:MAG: hypothetical protein MZV63_36525 [Marinilabiliales bacterium]|nr:hypothetical protein [Marinilabiliales bacterium]
MQAKRIQTIETEMLNRDEIKDYRKEAEKASDRRASSFLDFADDRFRKRRLSNPF